jgi:hypothetical protein
MFDFPNSPSLGTVFSPSGGPSWQWNGQGWVNVLPAGGVIGNIVVTLLTTPGTGTYTKPAGLRFLQVEGVGAGGSSGGPTATTLSTQGCGSGGGGAGAYGRRLFSAAELGATETYTIGAGGAAGAAGSNGAGGGNSQFGSTFNCTLVGGAASGRTTLVTTHTRADGGLGGAAGSGWTLGIPGGNGNATYLCYLGTTFAVRGEGGRSIWTPVTDSIITLGVQTPGTPTGYGGGGRGMLIQSQVNAAVVGSDGAQGAFILTEFY